MSGRDDERARREAEEAERQARITAQYEQAQRARQEAEAAARRGQQNGNH